jgi:hypothetical protein
MGLIKELVEENRRAQTGDDKFTQSFLYMFELQVPTHVQDPTSASEARYFFPLVLNPESIQMDEPFSAQLTETNEAGIFAEENGVLQRPLRISGHTGFAPKPMRGSSFEFARPEHKAFNRSTKTSTYPLSGQRHFQFLQDNVFRIYGELKNDPATAADTKLFFHNPKDDEYWRVIPRNFRMRRDASKPALYFYDIEMVAVAPADFDEVPQSEDKDFLDQLKDGISQARKAVQTVRAAAQELQGIIAAVDDLIDGIGGVFSDVIGVFGDVERFVQGVDDTIARPIKQVQNLLVSLDGFYQRMEALGDSFPENTRQSWASLVEATERILTNTAAFEGPVGTTVQSLQALTEVRGTESELLAAESNPPRTLVEARRAGTGPQAGDRIRSIRAPTAGTSEVTYRSAREYILARGDTLQNLAARLLGDARRWEIIAILNGLRSPYIADQRLPGALTIGDKILIPSTERPVETQPLLATHGAALTDSAEVRMLGTDFKLVPAAGARLFYDFEIDTANGSYDFVFASGIENLQQAVRTRVTTEIGADPLYQNLGVGRTVGTGLRDIDEVIQGYRYSRAINVDPRITSVLRAELSTIDSGDGLEIEVDARVRGFADPVVVRTTVE